MSDWSEEEKEEFRIEEAINEEREDRESESEKCPECGAIMKYECISSDADGNRKEWGYMCPNCD